MGDFFLLLTICLFYIVSINAGAKLKIERIGYFEIEKNYHRRKFEKIKNY